MEQSISSIIRLDRAGLNHLSQQGIDPEKLLNSAIYQMEVDLQNVRRAAIDSITNQKLLQHRYRRTQAEVSKWEQRAQLALRKGNECLAQEALRRKKIHSRVLNNFDIHSNQALALSELLKRDVALLEAKIFEAKAIRNSLKAVITAAELDSQLHAALDKVDANDFAEVFNQREEEILKIEASSQVEKEFCEANLEGQFDILDLNEELASMKAHLLNTPQQMLQADLGNQSASINAANEVDQELEAMRAQVLIASQQRQSQPSGSSLFGTLSDYSEIDIELENLKRALNQLE